MLNEFAVDPRVFGTLSEFRLWSERFGVDRARLIARYPKKWERRAIESIQETGVKRNSLVEKIRRLDEKGKMLDLGRKPYDGEISWLENALIQDKQLPFDGIIAIDNPRALPRVLIADEVEEDTVGFYVESGSLVPRAADQMAGAIRRILWAASRVVLVDPYFHPSESRFNEPLEAFLAEAIQGNPLTELEVHLAGDLKDSAPTGDFQRACQASLPAIVPAGLQLTIIRWRQAFRGDSLHPRYVLTDLCGVKIDHGLDQESEHQKTDIDLLPNGTYRVRSAQFRQGATAFNHKDTTIIKGTRGGAPVNE